MKEGDFLIYKRIKELCKASGDTITGLEAKLGFARGSLSKIDKNKPSSERVRKLAEYFNVTQNYILTGEDPKTTTIDFDVDAITKAVEKSVREEIIRKRHNGEQGYFFDQRTAEIAQEIANNKELGGLFDAARNASPEDLLTVQTMLEALKKKG